MVHVKTLGLVIYFYAFFFSSNAMARDRFDANIQPLYDACMTRCERNDVLGNLTREGCIKGCDHIRREFSLTGKSYSSQDACVEDIDDITMNRDLVIEEHQAWCVQYYEHIHKRQGCKDAINEFISQATTNNVCKRSTLSSQAPINMTPIPLQEQSVPTASMQKEYVAQNSSLVNKQSQSPVMQTAQPVSTPQPAILLPQRSSFPQSPAPSMKPLPTNAVAKSNSTVSTLLEAPLIKDTPKYSPAKPKRAKSAKKSSTKKGMQKTAVPPTQTSLPKDSPMPNNETFPGYVPLGSQSSVKDSIPLPTKTIGPTISTREALPAQKGKNIPTKPAQQVTTTTKKISQTIAPPIKETKKIIDPSLTSPLATQPATPPKAKTTSVSTPAIVAAPKTSTGPTTAAGSASNPMNTSTSKITPMSSNPPNNVSKVASTGNGTEQYKAIPMLPAEAISIPIPTIGNVNGSVQQPEKIFDGKPQSKPISSQPHNDKTVKDKTGLRIAPPEVVEPYGLSLPPSAIKAPPPPIP